jgi:sugar phosphate isomerase/epimerase
MIAFPLCCDTGHLLRSGSSIGEFLKRYGSRVEEIHLHGVRDGADHRPFAAGEPWFQGLVPFLSAFDGVVNIEVFSIGEVNTIVSALAEVGVLPKKGF